MEKEARGLGLKINKEKTKEMRINSRSQEKITVDGQDIGEVETFSHLGAIICNPTIHSDGGLTLETLALEYFTEANLPY